MVSRNVQRVSSGLSTLVQHISELQEWDAILLQELSFKDELVRQDELEASLRGHKIPLRHRYHHSQPMERRHPLVRFVTACAVGRPQGCGETHFLLCASSELGRQQQF